jgi:hypothetical protein
MYIPSMGAAIAKAAKERIAATMVNFMLTIFMYVV